MTANPPGCSAGSISVPGNSSQVSHSLEVVWLFTYFVDGKGTEAGEGDAPGARVEIPLQAVEKAMER